MTKLRGKNLADFYFNVNKMLLYQRDEPAVQPSVYNQSSVNLHCFVIEPAGVAIMTRSKTTLELP